MSVFSPFISLAQLSAVYNEAPLCQYRAIILKYCRFWGEIHALIYARHPSHHKTDYLLDGSSEIIVMLIKYGVKVYRTGRTMRTCLHGDRIKIWLICSRLKKLSYYLYSFSQCKYVKTIENALLIRNNWTILL